MLFLTQSLVRQRRRCLPPSCSSSAVYSYANLNKNANFHSTTKLLTTATAALPPSNTSDVAKMRIVAINDVYQLENLPKFDTFLSSLHKSSTTPNGKSSPDAVVLAGDFVSPSTLSSIDFGKGAIATLKSVGITHACLGNHEADLKLEVLKERISEFSMLSGDNSGHGKGTTVINTNMRRCGKDTKADDSSSLSSSSWLCNSSLVPPYSIITTPCQTVKVALLGLMSDESTLFRDGTFRGIPISDVLTTYEEYYQKLVVEEKLVDFVIPLTHQSLKRDAELAKFMLQQHGTVHDDSDVHKSIIIGGHEHYKIDKLVVEHDKEENADKLSDQSSVRILKSGTDAKHASIIDLEFDISSKPYRPINITPTMVDMAQYTNSPQIQKIVDKHMSVIVNLENEIIIDQSINSSDDHMDGFGSPSLSSSSSLESCLSSEGTRLHQTTMGGFLCLAIKDELEVDACIINGATIKGNTTYHDNRVSYAQLKQELPFPTKMIVVSMTRQELMDAIEYSRNDGGTTIKTTTGSSDGDAIIPRKGFLQTDSDLHSEIEQGEYYYKNSTDELTVALPRNLLNGFCGIQPLIEVGQKLKDANKFPDEDDYMAALDVVLRHACKAKWREIAHLMTFDDLDLNKDGVLDRYEIKMLMRQLLGYEPSDFAVDDMINAIDDNKTGTIDSGEFSYILATMERKKKW